MHKNLVYDRSELARAEAELAKAGVDAALLMECVVCFEPAEQYQKFDECACTVMTCVDCHEVNVSRGKPGCPQCGKE